MIDGEIYTRTSYGEKAIFAYRKANGLTNINIPHYACVLGISVYVKGYSGSSGTICCGTVRPATEQEIERFVDALREYGFHYNKANKKVRNISTGELL